MRRGLAWLAALVGTLMVLIGLAVAVVVGPDDTVSRSPHGLPAAGSEARMAYSSWPDLFPYRDLTLVVTARGGGSVFVGTANPLDAASYADGVRAYQFSEVSGSGRITAGRASDGTGVQPSVAPARARFWADKASSTREAQLPVPLDGSPLSVVAVAERGPLSLGFGVRLAGLFWTAVAVLLVGLALLSYGVWRLRRGPAADATVVRAGSMTAGGVALLLLASGCGWVPQAVEPKPATKIPMTRSELQGVLDDYDRRNNAAIKASDTKFDGSLWAQADSGSVLAADLLRTKIGRAEGKKGTGIGLRTRALNLYAPSGTGYPLTFIATSDVIRAGAKVTREQLAKQAYASIDVWSKHCVTCPWTVNATAAVPRDRQPAPLPVGKASTATGQQRRAALALSEDLTEYLRTGRLRLIAANADLKKMRRFFAKADSFERTRLEGEAYADGALRVVRVKGGALAVLQHSFTQTSFAKYENGYLFWKEKAFAAAIGQSGDQDYLTQSGVLVTTVSIPDRDKPVLLDASWDVTGP